MEKNFYLSVGKRKTAIARILLKKGSGLIQVNKRDYKDYFLKEWHYIKCMQPIEVTATENLYDFIIKVEGGGLSAQAEACRLGIARALVKLDIQNRASLKKNKFLTRDARVAERKKYGQRGARRSFQFSKR